MNTNSILEQWPLGIHVTVFSSHVTNIQVDQTTVGDRALTETLEAWFWGLVSPAIMVRVLRKSTDVREYQFHFIGRERLKNPK